MRPTGSPDWPWRSANSPPDPGPHRLAGRGLRRGGGREWRVRRGGFRGGAASRTFSARRVPCRWPGVARAAWRVPRWWAGAARAARRVPCGGRQFRARRGGFRGGGRGWRVRRGEFRGGGREWRVRRGGFHDRPRVPRVTRESRVGGHESHARRGESRAGPRESHTQRGESHLIGAGGTFIGAHSGPAHAMPCSAGTMPPAPATRATREPGVKPPFGAVLPRPRIGLTTN